METQSVTPNRGPLLSAQPYLNWVIGNSGIYLRSGSWLPLLVEFRKDANLRQFLDALTEGKDRSAFIRVPPPFRMPRGVDTFLPDNFKFCIVLLLKKALDAAKTKRALEEGCDPMHIVTDMDWSRFVLRSEVGPPLPRPDLFNSPFLPLAKLSKGSGVPNRVVVGVIDEGIAFAHPRFRRPASNGGERTRVEYAWVQDAGIEITASQIDAAVANAKNRGADDESIYRALHVLDMTFDGYKPLARRQSHGTHVLDMASGYDIDRAPATRPIIEVDMPEAAVGDPAGSTLKVHAAWGLIYILWRANSLRQAGETLPIVVNLSYGPQEGPHDGNSAFERFADALTLWSHWMTDTPMRLVLAAGNYRQGRAHASFRLDAAKPRQTLEWRLQPCGLTPSIMEIYFPMGQAVKVTLKPPRGPSLAISTSATPNKPVQEPMGAPSPPGPSYSMEYVNDGTPLSSIVIFVAPTARDFWLPDNVPVVPSGIWKVTVEITASSSVEFNAWIKRSDTPPGRRARGRQSYFDDAAYPRYDPCGRPIEYDVVDASYVQRQNTLSGIATGYQTYVIGAYQRGPDPTDQIPTFYTSEAAANPPPGPVRLGVHWLAPAEDAFACPGELGAGTRSGMRVAMNGTSVASPQAVRYFANVWSTGVEPGSTPLVALEPVSTRVPFRDRLPVAGVGLMPLNPPEGRRPIWKSRP